jgi:hypothetical protein
VVFVSSSASDSASAFERVTFFLTALINPETPFTAARAAIPSNTMAPKLSLPVFGSLIDVKFLRASSTFLLPLLSVLISTSSSIWSFFSAGSTLVRVIPKIASIIPRRILNTF